LWIAQRELLLKVLGLLLKYPILIVSGATRSGWNMVLKPIIRKVLMRGAAPAGELPGGSY